MNCYLPVAKNRSSVLQHRGVTDDIAKFIKKHKHVIITGDLNGWLHSHNLHKVPANSPQFQQGLNLSNLATNCNLKILDKDPQAQTRVDSAGNGTTVDYFMYRGVCLGKQSVSPFIPGTDHRAISTQILHVKKPKARSKRKLVRPVHKLTSDNELRHAYRDNLESKFEK